MAIAHEPKVEEMTLEQAQAALKAIAEGRRALIRAADVAGLKRAKHKETDLKARIAELQVEGLKATVERLEQQRRETLKAMQQRITEAHEQADAARGEIEECGPRLQAAQERLALAFAVMDQAPTMADGVDRQIREARDRLEQAMQALIAE
jgi:hypothetical protein